MDVIIFPREMHSMQIPQEVMDWLMIAKHLVGTDTALKKTTITATKTITSTMSRMKGADMMATTIQATKGTIRILTIMIATNLAMTIAVQESVMSSTMGGKLSQTMIQHLKVINQGLIITPLMSEVILHRASTKEQTNNKISGKREIQIVALNQSHQDMLPLPRVILKQTFKVIEITLTTHQTSSHPAIAINHLCEIVVTEDLTMGGKAFNLRDHHTVKGSDLMIIITVKIATMATGDASKEISTIITGRTEHSLTAPIKMMGNMEATITMGADENTEIILILTNVSTGNTLAHFTCCLHSWGM